MAAKYSEFEGKWGDIDEDGMWDGPTDEQEDDISDGEGDWEEYDNEDMPSPLHFEKMNNGLLDEGLIVVWYWRFGDPGMGGASKMFHLPPDRV